MSAMTSPTLTQFRAAAATLRKAGHPEVAEHLRLLAKAQFSRAQWGAAMRQSGKSSLRFAAIQQYAEDLARCADPNDEGAAIDTLDSYEPPGGWRPTVTSL